MKDRSYRDWFGSGDTNEDVKEAIEEFGEPLKVFYEKEGFFAALVYQDKVVVVGHSGDDFGGQIVMDDQEK